MRSSSWKIAECLPGEYTQLRLFPPTQIEILSFRIKELEEKLERQRKGQFGKIGAIGKQCKELFERLEIIEKGLCLGTIEIPEKTTCEIVEMAIM